MAQVALQDPSTARHLNPRPLLRSRRVKHCVRSRAIRTCSCVCGPGRPAIYIRYSDSSVLHQSCYWQHGICWTSPLHHGCHADKCGTRTHYKSCLQSHPGAASCSLHGPAVEQHFLICHEPIDFFKLTFAVSTIAHGLRIVRLPDPSVAFLIKQLLAGARRLRAS